MIPELHLFWSGRYLKPHTLNLFPKSITKSKGIILSSRLCQSVDVFPSKILLTFSSLIPNIFQSFFEISNFSRPTGLHLPEAGSQAIAFTSTFPSAEKGAVYV